MAFSQGADAGARRPLQDVRRVAPTATCAARAAAWWCSSGWRDALADGDRVLAVIRGSAVNQDGRSSGLTAPNGPAQEARDPRGARQQPGSTPREVELRRGARHRHRARRPDRGAGARRGARPGRAPGQPLLIGSVKTNIGHLEAAAGIAGLIKVVLALQHGAIPAAPALPRRPTRTSPGTRCRLQVPTRRAPWPAAIDAPRSPG